MATQVNPPTISGLATVCPGGTTTLTASGCNGDVTWSNGTTGNTLANAPAGTYTATCTINGVASPASNPITVTEAVVNAPTLAATSPSVCPGATTTLTASGCNGNVTWSNGATGASIDAAAGSYSAKCTISLDGGSDCVSASSDAIVIHETQVTAPTISSGPTACPAGTATLTASNCNGDVTWSNGATGASVTAPVGSYTATCTINGCVSQASGSVSVAPCNMLPCPTDGNLIENGSFENPIVAGTLPWEHIEVPDWINITDSGKLELRRSTNVVASDGNQYIELNGYDRADIYQDITVPATGESLNWSLDHRRRLDAGPDPNQAITVIVSAADGSNPQTVTHVAGPRSWEQVAGTYQTLPGQTTVRIRVISSGGDDPQRGNFIDNIKANYTSCITAARATQQPENRTTVSLSVQPNPVIAQTALILTGFEEGMVSIDIISANGVHSKNLKMHYTNDAKLILDLANLRDGMYFIKVLQNGKTATAKFTKQQ